MQYCFVQNNVIGNPQNLPINWQNVSNFYVLPQEELAKYNWHPFNPATPPAYNPATQSLQSSLKFDGQQVNQVWQVTDNPIPANITANLTANGTI